MAELSLPEQLGALAVTVRGQESKTMAIDPKPERMTDAPAHDQTAARPGQSGEQGERRPGPSPLSPNATGPHPPYEPHDPEGLAAGKNVRPEPKTPVRPDAKSDNGISAPGDDT